MVPIDRHGDVASPIAPASPGWVPDGLNRRHLFGLDFVDAPDLGDVIDALFAVSDRLVNWEASRPELPVVVTPNVDILVGLTKAPTSIEQSVFSRAQWVLPDGMPIVAASRLAGEPLGARLPGSGLFEQLWPRFVDENTPVVVLCANEVIADRLGAQHPGAVFIVPPMVDVDDREALGRVVDQLEDEACAVDAQFILLGLGHPKDAVLIHFLAKRFQHRHGGRPSPICLGLGASFAMYVGLTKRAPEWMQRAGLEWLHRWAQEPRRLFRRYFVRDVYFFAIAARELWRLRVGRRR